MDKKKENRGWETEKVEEKKSDNRENSISSEKEKKWIKKEGELAVDVYETNKNIIIQAPVAGVKREDLEIITEKDTVIIKGERTRPEKEHIEKFYINECFFGSFQREIILPEETDPSRIEATMREGVLVVKIPKIEREKRRKIEI